MEKNIEQEIDEVTGFIAAMKEDRNQSWSVKQMESYAKQLRTKLEILTNSDYKDDVITFEELGVDCLMIDEAHNYKNLSFTTKISRVAGINPNGSNKAFDLLQKVRYINELNANRNVVFATGTPISNTMCEMYLMTKYLQADLLREKGIYHLMHGQRILEKLLLQWSFLRKEKDTGKKQGLENLQIYLSL